MHAEREPGKNSQHFATPPLASRANILRRASRVCREGYATTGFRANGGRAKCGLFSPRLAEEFPASRGLSRRGKNERKERDLSSS